MKRFLTIIFVFLFLTVVYENLISYDDGIGGHTRKNVGTLGDGCICHRADSTTGVVVRITGPALVGPNSVNIYRITMRGGPAIAGGFDFNVKFGNVDTVQGQQTVKIVFPVDSINDISHSWPQNFAGDSVSWLVKYIAPGKSVVIHDTLYATGNSVNFNGVPDDSDRWNFSPNFVVEVNPSIGIQPISSTAESFSLGQNYPNPFNPATRIRFSIPPGNNTDRAVHLVVYNIQGKEVVTLVNYELQPGIYEYEWDASNFASGIYYYKLTNGRSSQVKKMVLVK